MRSMAVNLTTIILASLLTGCALPLELNSLRSLPGFVGKLFTLGQTSATSASAIAGFNQPGQIAIGGNKLIVVDSGNNRVSIWNNYSSMTVLQAPDVVLGQPDKGQRSIRTPSAKDLNSPFGVTTDGVKLFVSDGASNRVLVWNTIPTADYTPADFVLGQPDFSSIAAGSGQAGLGYQYEIFYAAGKLLVSDYNNGRVLVWTQPITSNGQPADLVLGKPNFTSTTGGTTSALMTGPDGVWTDGTKVLVTDYRQHRVLGWNSFPTANGQAADFVLGQPDFVSATANNGGLSAARMFYPWDVKSDGTRIAVADTSNHRVLVWSTWPTANGQPADIIIGQANGTTGSANQGLTSPSAQTLSYPEELFLSATELLIDDYSNKRILSYNLAGLATNASASRVIGQRNFTEAIDSILAGGANASNMSLPTGSASDGTHLAVADCGNNRVLIWNSMVTSNAPADVVIGQSSMMGFVPNSGVAANASSLSCPSAVAFSGNKLFIADQNNNRVLVYNQVPMSNGVGANYVLGQPDLVSVAPNNGGISASTLSGPAGLLVRGSTLVVTDRNNHRALIWNSIPSSNGQAADIVVGQPNMTSAGAATTAAGFYYPTGNATSDGFKLIISDSANNRVLVWNSLPSTNGQPADLVIGQQSMTTNIGSYQSFKIDVNTNDSLIHQVTLYALDWDSTTRAVRIDVQDPNGQLLDSQNVTAYNGGINLVWNVKGHVIFRVQTTGTSNGTISAVYFDPVTSGGVPSAPVGATFVTQDLTTQGSWVGKYGTEGYVLSGQTTSLPAYVSTVTFPFANFNGWANAVTTDVRGVQNAAGTARVASCWYTGYSGKPDARTMSSPTGVFVQGGRLLVADRNNNRVLVWNSLPPTNGVAADQVIGQTDLYSSDSVYSPLGLSQPMGLSYFGAFFYITDSSNNRVVAYPVGLYPQLAP